MPLGRARPSGGFPWLGESERFEFPDPRSAPPDAPLCSGANLSPGMLVSAYSQGIFPWFNPGDPILWWSPDPRFVVYPRSVHASGTMRKIIKRRRYELRLDSAFGEVIRLCSTVFRPRQRGTWITAGMVEAYEGLHELGLAHSAEAWLDGRLVGGLYGVSLGSAFFGESMFSLEPDASKAAFIPLAWRLADEGFTLIDSQVRTAHVESMGGQDLARDAYLAELSSALKAPTRRGSWAEAFPGFPDSAAYRGLVESSRA